MVSASNSYRNKLWLLYDAYVEEIDKSGLAPSSKIDYKIFAEQFVRWIEGEFTPGINTKKIEAPATINKIRRSSTYGKE